MRWHTKHKHLNIRNKPEKSLNIIARPAVPHPHHSMASVRHKLQAAYTAPVNLLMFCRISLKGALCTF